MVIDKVNTKSKIQDVAEGFIIKGGYDSFSFRDIAEAVGIKSASVHYHYPTKGDLVAAVMARYVTHFSSQLPDPLSVELNPIEMLHGFIDGFKVKVVDQGNMSLCTMLTWNKSVLPSVVCEELASFYNIILEWLTKVFMRLDSVNDENAQLKAHQLFACLHGASILAQGTNNAQCFDQAIAYWRVTYPLNT